MGLCALSSLVEISLNCFANADYLAGEICNMIPSVGFLFGAVFFYYERELQLLQSTANAPFADLLLPFADYLKEDAYNYTSVIYLLIRCHHHLAERWRVGAI